MSDAELSDESKTWLVGLFALLVLAVAIGFPYVLFTNPHTTGILTGIVVGVFAVPYAAGWVVRRYLAN